jgi:hypothetical protein
VGKACRESPVAKFFLFFNQSSGGMGKAPRGVQLGCTLTEEEEEGGPRRRAIWRGGGGEGGPVPAGRAHRGYERWSVRRYC